jgi:hypothetical protein
MDMNSAVDVRDVLGAVRVPTLILHREADVLVPVGGAQYFADHLPAATLRVLEGADHLPCVNADQILDEIEAFLREAHATRGQSLALAAVVVVAGAPVTPVIDTLVERGGRARATPDGGRVVLFDGPATAVRCTLASLNRHARAGVSIAEIDRDSLVVDGPGVRLAEQIAQAGAAGELWVSAAAAMLLSGSGVALSPATEGGAARVNAS